MESRGINVDSEKTGKGIKVQIYLCNALPNREWLQMDGITKKIWKVSYSLYEIYIDGPKTVQLAKLLLASFKTLF